MAHRIAGEAQLGLGASREIDDCRERRCDGVDARCEDAVGAAHHRILLMDERRNPKSSRSKHRRKGRITPEARKRNWTNMAEHR
jgi:hypothetical protein